MEKSRWWLVRVVDGVEWIGKLPKSSQVWCVKASARMESFYQASKDYVLAYEHPVSQRWVCKLPVLSVVKWSCDPHELSDRTKYAKLKWQDEATAAFYKQFNPHNHH